MLQLPVKNAREETLSGRFQLHLLILEAVWLLEVPAAVVAAVAWEVLAILAGTELSDFANRLLLNQVW